MNRDYSIVKREISGFGVGYEKTCREMVLAALKWFDKNPKADLKYKEFKNGYGITTGESEDMKKMQKAMLKAAKNDCTGAMMQATMSHAMYIIANGWNKYVEEMNKEAAQR